MLKTANYNVKLITLSRDALQCCREAENYALFSLRHNVKLMRFYLRCCCMNCCPKFLQQKFLRLILQSYPEVLHHPNNPEDPCHLLERSPPNFEGILKVAFRASTVRKKYGFRKVSTETERRYGSSVIRYGNSRFL